MERIAVNVSKQHLRKVNQEISFKAYANEITVILSLDSSLIHSLILKMLKSKNTGVSYYEHKLEKQREYILNFLGYMPSSLPSFKHMTIEEYFKYSAKFYQGDYNNNFEALLNFFNLDKDLKIKVLSYEEKKIINFIDSIFFEPEVLILEDPFSNISNINVVKIIKCITKLKDNGFSVILTNLKYDELDIADHIYLLTNEGLSEFKKNKKNKISVSFEYDSNIEIKDFLNDIEAYDIIITNNNVAFKYDGNINSLLTKLNKIKLNSLKIYPQDIYQLGV